MTTIKRSYVYLVCFISLGMVVAGVTMLLDLLVEPWLGGSRAVGTSAYRQDFAFAAALLIAGLPVWAGHWIAAQRSMTRDAAGERRSLLRKLYLYLVLALAALAALEFASEVLTRLFDLTLGNRQFNRVDLAHAIVRLVVALVVWLYHWRVVAADRALAPERGGRATLRRWYVYGVALGGLAVFAIAAAWLAGATWEAWLDTGSRLFLREVIAQYAGSALAGLGIWWWHVRSAGAGERPHPRPLPEGEGTGVLGEPSSQQPVASSQQPAWDDGGSTLRKVFLFAAVAFTAGGALYYASQALYELARAALGFTPGVRPLVLGVGREVGGLLVFGALWAFHWRAVEREAAAQPELPRQATIRRIYFYLVSLVGAAMLVGALAGTLRLLIDFADGAARLEGAGGWREQLALYVTLAIVGLPVWLYHWQRVQRVARSAGPTGAAERRSLTRRLYLYLGILAGVLTLLFHGATILYNFLKVLLGEPPEGDLWQLTKAVSDSTVLGLVLLYSWRTLRADAAWAETMPAEEATVPAPAGPATERGAPVAYALAVIAGPDPAAIAAALEQLADRLPDGRLTVRWTDAAGAAAALAGEGR